MPYSSRFVAVAAAALVAGAGRLRSLARERGSQSPPHDLDQWRQRLTQAKRARAGHVVMEYRKPKMNASVPASALRRILVVDHQRETRMVVEFSLGKIYGYEVVTCASGAEALERAPGFAPDLVLLDLGMPELDGPATIAKPFDPLKVSRQLRRIWDGRAQRARARA